MMNKAIIKVLEIKVPRDYKQDFIRVIQELSEKKRFMTEQGMNYNLRVIV